MTTMMIDAPRSAPPDRSLQQRRDALARANDVRVYRKHLKRDVKAGRVSVRSVILVPPAEVLTMRIFDLLLTVPKQGRVKVNKILAQCRIAPSKTIGGLSERQRGEIANHVRRATT